MRCLHWDWMKGIRSETMGKKATGIFGGGKKEENGLQLVEGKERNFLLRNYKEIQGRERKKGG